MHTCHELNRKTNSILAPLADLLNGGGGPGGASERAGTGMSPIRRKGKIQNDDAGVFVCGRGVASRRFALIFLIAASKSFKTHVQSCTVPSYAHSSLTTGCKPIDLYPNKSSISIDLYSEPMRQVGGP